MIYHISLPVSFEVEVEDDRLSADEALEVCKKSLSFSFLECRDGMTIKNTSSSEATIMEEYCI